MIWEAFRLDVSFICFFGPEECFSSGVGWDRSLNGLIHTF